jgi:hypothetical protein
MFTKRRTVGLASTAWLILALLAPGVAQAEEPAPLAYKNGNLMTTNRVPIVANGRIQLHSSLVGKVECINTFFAEGWNAHEHGEETKTRGYGEVLGWGTSQCTAPEEIKAIEEGPKPKEEHSPLPITVVASSELPVEKQYRQGEICKEETKTLLECSKNPATERETKLLVKEFGFHRRVSTLPWKLELIRGEREEEHGILQKVGLHEFGESGTAAAQNTKCYPKEKIGTEEREASFEKVPSGCIAVDIIFPQIPYEYVFYGTQEIWGVNGAGNGLDASRLEFREAGKLFSSKGAYGEGETTGVVRLSGEEAVELITAE